MFRAPAMLLPHESTVAHEQRFKMGEPMISRTRSRTLAAGISVDASTFILDDCSKDSSVSIIWL
jgi:hypothetical protein